MPIAAKMPHKKPSNGMARESRLPCVQKQKAPVSASTNASISLQVGFLFTVRQVTATTIIMLSCSNIVAVPEFVMESVTR